MSSKAAYRRRQINRLWHRQKGACFYCATLMRKGPWDPKFPIPDNACTLEHTIPKGHPLRGKAQKCVAACLKCNREKNLEFLKGGPQLETCPKDLRRHNPPRVVRKRPLPHTHGTGHLQFNADGTFSWHGMKHWKVGLQFLAGGVHDNATAVRKDQQEGVSLLAGDKAVGQLNGDRRSGAGRKRKNERQEQTSHHSTVPPQLRWS